MNPKMGDLERYFAQTSRSRVEMSTGQRISPNDSDLSEIGDEKDKNNSGFRYVTVAPVDPLAGDWAAPHAPIRFLTATGKTRDVRFSDDDSAFARALANLTTAARVADIYFPTVSANPVDGGRTLLGLFATALEREDLESSVHDRGRSPEVGAILLSVSLDAVHWAPPVALASVFPNRGELNDHAVDGFVRAGPRVFFYVHAGVPGTLGHLCPRFAPPRPPPSRLVRYALKARNLARYTKDAVRRLRSAPPDDAVVANRSGIFVIPAS
jgi:hypothetical protein